jgi:23S rRNA-/tRNA-specific pseudouridylate synthase
VTVSDSSPDSSREILRAVDEALRTRYWTWSIYRQDETKQGLLALLIERLPHIAPDSWSSRFDFGGIYVNGLEAREDQALPTPCKIEYYEPKFEISEASSIFPLFKPEYIIYRDDYIVVAYKPPGLSSMPAKEQRHFSVKAAVESLTNSSIHMPSRLDVSAQGLILMSIAPQSHANLQRAFESRTVTKTYLCASSALPTWTTKRVTAPIARSPLHPVLRTTETGNGQQAETIFELLRSYPNQQPIHVFKAEPVTGRTHQIRVHAAHEGIPLLGDKFYGGTPSNYLHLVSYQISCKHPITGEPFLCTLPEHFQPAWVRAPVPPSD